MIVTITFIHCLFSASPHYGTLCYLSPVLSVLLNCHQLLSVKHILTEYTSYNQTQQVVKVIWQKAASLPHMDGAVVFNRWSSVHLHLIRDISWAHPSPQPKRHLDRFNHFCKADGRVSLGMSFLQKIVPLHGAIWTPIYYMVLRPPESPPLTASRMVKPFLHSWRRSVPLLYDNCPFPLHNCCFPVGGSTHMISLVPSKPTIQTASRSVRPFLQGSLDQHIGHATRSVAVGRIQLVPRCVLTVLRTY